MPPPAYLATLGANFPSVPSGQKFIWGGPTVFGGIYIGEKIILTAAHPLYDIRWSSTAPLVPFYEVRYSNAGLSTSSGITSSSLSVNVDAGFVPFLQADFARNVNPYSNTSIAEVDRAYMTVGTGISTSRLLGTAVFYGPSASSNSMIGTQTTMHSWQGVKTGTIDELDTSNDVFSANFTSIPGDSGSGFTVSFRSVIVGDQQIIGVQSLNAPGRGAVGSLLGVGMFDAIMNALSLGKTGSQATQPRNYLHGSDGDDAINGTFRPDVIFGNAGSDIITDGDQGTVYWANDRLAGGAGDDTFKAGRGNDLIYGGDWALPVGTSDISTDGIDSLRLDGLNVGKAGFEITIGGTALSNLYNNIPNYNKAVFLKDIVTGDIDTLISVEKLFGSAGSDKVIVKSLTAPSLVDVAQQGGLNYLDFGTTKSSGEVDVLDLSQLQGPVTVNLSDSNSIPIDPYDWSPPSYNPVYTGGGLIYAANSLQAADQTGTKILVKGFNYVIGTNFVNSTGTLTGDILIGSNRAETFVATLGQDIFIVGGGDTITLPQFSGKSLDDVTGRESDAGYGCLVLFNGWELGGFIADDGVIGPSNAEMTGSYHSLFGEPFTLYYDASTMTATITDTRDSSTLILDNFLQGLLHIFLVGQINNSAALNAAQTPKPEFSEVFISDLEHLNYLGDMEMSRFSSDWQQLSQGELFF